MALAVIIMAAGKGTRMKSDLPKVLHQANGRPLVDYVLNTANTLDPEKTVLVVGHQAEKVVHAISTYKAAIALQVPQLGTGHAVMQTQGLLHDFDGDVLILSGDAPLVTATTLKKLIAFHRSTHASATVLTAELDNPTGYGRIIREKESDTVLKIVEQKDASEEEGAVKEINSGVYVFKCSELFEALGQINTNNAQNEYYLTDIFGIFCAEGKKIRSFKTDNPNEIIGINTPEQLMEAEVLLQQNPDLFPGAARPF